MKRVILLLLNNILDIDYSCPMRNKINRTIIIVFISIIFLGGQGCDLPQNNQELSIYGAWDYFDRYDHEYEGNILFNENNTCEQRIYRNNELFFEEYSFFNIIDEETIIFSKIEGNFEDRPIRKYKLYENLLKIYNEGSDVPMAEYTR